TCGAQTRAPDTTKRHHYTPGPASAGLLVKRAQEAYHRPLFALSRRNQDNVDLIEAIFLGIVQGATEFLPVSSSGHLVLFPALFGLPAPGLTLISIAHQGTMVAVLIYFWRDLWAIVRGVVQGLARRQPLGTADARLGWLIVAGTIPAGLAGLLFEDFFEEL